MGKRLTIVLAAFAALPLLYVAAYFALVYRDPVLGIGSFSGWNYAPQYRIGGHAAAKFFGPIHRVDSLHLRRSYWHDLYEQ